MEFALICNILFWIPSLMCPFVTAEPIGWQVYFISKPQNCRRWTLYKVVSKARGWTCQQNQWIWVLDPSLSVVDWSGSYTSLLTSLGFSVIICEMMELNCINGKVPFSSEIQWLYTSTYTQATESVALPKEYITDLIVAGRGHGEREPILRINAH